MDAVTVALWSAVTAAAVAVKAAVVAPEVTGIEAGTVNAEGRLLASDTFALALETGLESVSVQPVLADAASVVFAQFSAVTDNGARIVNAWAWLEAPSETVTVALCSDVTAPAVAVKVPVVAPSVTVTEDGTVKAAGRLLVSDRVAPPLEAAFESVTVQLAVRVAITVVLAHCSEEIEIGAMTDTTHDRFDPPSQAVKVES